MPKMTPPPLHDEIDNATLDLAALGDANAWRIVLRKVYRRVAVIIGNNSPDVGDLTHEACIKLSIALKGRRSVRPADDAAVPPPRRPKPTPRGGSRGQLGRGTLSDSDEDRQLERQSPRSATSHPAADGKSD